MQETAPEFVARHFHEEYERSAARFSYKTREASAVPWEDVPATNKALMCHVTTRLIASHVIIAGPAWGTSHVSSITSEGTRADDPEQMWELEWRYFTIPLPRWLGEAYELRWQTRQAIFLSGFICGLMFAGLAVLFGLLLAVM